jgi:hypothetical protein
MAGSEGVTQLRETVGGFLRASFAEVRVDQDDDFEVRHRGVTTWVQLRAIDADETAVLVWTVSNVGMAVTDEMTRFLAVESDRLTFGQFELHEQPPRIHVSHALLGAFLSREELEVAVDAVAAAAADYGPVVKEAFGGVLAVELPASAGPERAT